MAARWVLLISLMLLAAISYAEDEAAVLEKTSQLGPLSARISMSPEKPVIGDALNLTLEVIAEQGIEVLMPEFGQAFERFAIVDFVPGERIDDQGRTVYSQRYTLQASASGEQQIPPIIIEFIDHRPGQRAAPEGEDSYELLTERIPFTVQSVAPAEAGSALKPPLGELAPIDTTPQSSGAWLWTLVVLVLAAPLGWWIFKVLRRRLRQRSAFDIASARLQALRANTQFDATAMKPFFIELSAIVRRYLEDQFALHAPELTTEEFLDIAAVSPDLSSEQRQFLRDFLQQADQVKFARHIPDAEHAHSALDAAAQFLEQTRVRESEKKTVKTAEPVHA